MTSFEALKIHVARSKSVICSHISSALPTKSDLLDWNFVDAAYLITTTNSDPTRLNRSRNELESIDLWKFVKLHLVEPDDADRIRGCYNSHIQVLRRALDEVKQPNRRILVLEDNLEKSMRFSSSSLTALKDFSLTETNWDLIHLACMMYVPKFSLELLDDMDHILRVKGDKGAAVGTTAYLISTSGINKILEFHEKFGYTMPIPNVMSLLFERSRYGVYPMLFHRAGKVPSLVNPQVR